MFDTTQDTTIDWCTGQYEGYGTSDAPDYGWIYVHRANGDIIGEADGWEAAKWLMESDS